VLNIFIDSDIILDLLTKRDPYYIHAAKLFTLIDQNKIQAHTSPIVYANLHYLLKKLTSPDFALQSLRKLKNLVKVLSVDEKVINQALNSDFKDFEDAIQYYTAINNEMKFFITRNISDYQKSQIPVCTAEEYLKIRHAQHEL